MSNLVHGKNTINLLQAELLPKQALLTLKRVVISWGVIVLVLFLGIFISQYQLYQNQAQLKQITKVNAEQKNKLADLEYRVSQHKPKQQLVSKLATLKLLIANKKNLHRELTNTNSTYVAGFAQAMTDLSLMHSKDISLQQVSISHDEMTFSGMARAPESVPAWLAQFESSSVLSGKVFSHFSLTENDSDYLDFVVSTNRVKVNK
jgi:cell division protein FtsL